ncbi:hypothetical protein WN51_11245 [Melipona quadrifasciata]|uniref:Uncharacterized protein n=1 Tax=Melipona quadrifasciata TaxID=166423 RepID=A0A0N0BHR8_9HYME|nr:hypothetical protein WN51_11245 [Melipona quadrifasciata]
MLSEIFQKRNRFAFGFVETKRRSIHCRVKSSIAIVSIKLPVVQGFEESRCLETLVASCNEVRVERVTREQYTRGDIQRGRVDSTEEAVTLTQVIRYPRSPSQLLAHIPADLCYCSFTTFHGDPTSDPRESQ